nr:LacI family DNA-binding transcriptional regulator [Rubellimicrobium arenae]
MAQAAGVSVSTVNRVLSGNAKVRTETIEHVLAVAQQLNFYGTSAIRSRLKKDQTPCHLGLLLQQETMPFHSELGRRFRAEVDRMEERHLVAHVEHTDDLDPMVVADRLRKLGTRCSAVALAVADHPAVNRVVDDLAAEGKAVFTVVSDLSASGRAGYVGLDNRLFGRAAAWYAAHLIRQGSEAVVVMGTHRHLCQEQREMGFRSYLREHAPDLTLLETATTLEMDQGAYEVTRDLLRRHPNLGLIYVTGGGVRGCLRALREVDGSPRPRVISCELNADTQAALVDGLLTVALAHPMGTLVDRLVRVMVAATDPAEGFAGGDTLVPYVTVTSENAYSDAL